MNINEPKWMWKEAFVAYLPGGTEKNHENLSQDG
jgi:hypothetical protein